jgi:hypothetical protein
VKRLDFGRSALASCVAAAMLAGCGGKQPPIGAPGAMPQTSAVAHAGRDTSWTSGAPVATVQASVPKLAGSSEYVEYSGLRTLPDTKSQRLLYVSNDGSPFVVYVLSYPSGKKVGTLDGFFGPGGECTEASGDVFITDTAEGGAGYIYEYAHGGTSPIVTLDDPFTWPNGCAVDPTAGNLAVISVGGAAVFPNASGTPAAYTDSTLSEMTYGAYDNKGNLFVDGTASSSGRFAFAELPRGASTFTNISVSDSFENAGSVQWDGSYITVQTTGNSGRVVLIYRLAVSGSSATVVGTTTLTSNRNRFEGGQYWIQGSSVIGPANRGKSVAIWRYPQGGHSKKMIRGAGNSARGVTVSVAGS